MFVVVYCAQLMSINESGDYISRLAIENSDHIYLFINYKLITLSIVLSLIFVLFIVLIEKINTSVYCKCNFKIIVSLILIIVLSLILNNNNWFYKKEIEQYDEYVRYDSVNRASPLASLYSVIFLQNISLTKELLGDNFKTPEFDEIRKFGFQYNSDSAYPLIKETIYTGPPPFPTKAQLPQKTNIIVLFSEGISARSLGVYGSKYPEITPYVDDFAQSSMVVHNYYNHTAATYRGLHGQLNSIFPTYGGIGGWQTNYEDLKGIRYFGLGEIFKRRNYETIFLDAHHKRHKSRVDEMIKRLGFMTVLTGDVLSERYLENAQPEIDNAFSDSQFFSGVIGFLEERAKNNGIDRPFFMGLYNFGTHAFLDRTEDGVKYGDGENYALNSIYNFDKSFGLFWEYFKKSPYVNNTIIILTADHCHYPEKPFVTAFKGPGYQKYFVDRIPYIIFDPTRVLPESYNVHNSTSVDFAPSLVHYLDLGNFKNPFMGTSMYEQNRKKYDELGVSFFGVKDLYIIDDEKIHRIGIEGNHSNRLEILKKYINASQQLELADQLWDNSSH